MDVFKFNPTNLDPLTETYDLNFYFKYLAEWPHLFNVATGPNGTIDAYRMPPSIPPLRAPANKQQ
jgi:N-terminal acetyltransferase B complex catalytic subunit